MKKIKLPKEYSIDSFIDAYAETLPTKYSGGYYSAKSILQKHADYSMIFGEKSNGKSYQIICLAFTLWYYYRRQTGVIRRLDENLKARYGKKIFANLEYNEEIIKETKGEYQGYIDLLSNHEFNCIEYNSREWYVGKREENGEVKLCKDVFASAFALTKLEDYNSTSYPKIDIIFFDEFISVNGYYLTNEFVDFMILCSTIIRKRSDVKIFMCANSHSRYSIYFTEMGLKHVKEMEQGTIDEYSYGDSTLKVCVEYCEVSDKNKASNKFFAFDNPKLKMITSGEWKIDLYPHLPVKYLDKECLYYGYIEFGDELMQFNLIMVDKNIFLYIHRKTTPIKEDNKQLVFSQKIHHEFNYKRKIGNDNKVELWMRWCIANDKVFYSDNEIGDTFNNYLKWCSTI